MEKPQKTDYYTLSLVMLYFLISFIGNLDCPPPIKMYIHSLFVAVSLCEEDLALTIYYMTEEAGCSLPPTELSLCTCLGKLCRLTATQPHFLRTKTQ